MTRSDSVAQVEHYMLNPVRAKGRQSNPWRLFADKAVRERDRAVQQIACFDMAFHHCSRACSHCRREQVERVARRYAVGDLHAAVSRFAACQL